MASSKTRTAVEKEMGWGDQPRQGRGADRKANDRIAFAVFAREFQTQVDSMATMAEIRAAFDAQRGS